MVLEEKDAIINENEVLQDKVKVKQCVTRERCKRQKKQGATKESSEV